MPNQELTDFIKNSKAAGQTDEQIKSALKQSGWQEMDIKEGFKSISIPAPAQNYSDVPYSNKQSTNFISSESKSRKKLVIAIIIIFILLVSGAFGFYKYVYNELLKNNESQSTLTPSASSTAPASTTTTCDNYQCLISAASQCQPTSVTISYSGIPFPLDPNMSVSGQTQYEIKKSSGANDCVLIFSFPVTSLSISDEGRKAALAQGMTDAQITAQLQTMSDSYKLIAGTQITCPSNAGAISDYLTDAKNGNFKIEVKVNSTGQTTTYTTSSGQKLVCTVTLERQSANTSVTIKDTECSAQKGIGTAVTDTETACSKNQIDLGTIVGNLKLNNKYPQCCVLK